ncbi:YDG domain-containing protein, partial [bacterium 210820-DFI.6.37]|nr:YDG domain-containing protein [bacterium 210820-DFI.6.37]
TGSDGSVSFKWYIKNSDAKYELLENAPTSAGSYKVIAILESDDNYLEASTEKAFAISRKPLTATVKANDKTYDGTTGAEIIVGLDTGVKEETLTIEGLSGSFDDANAGEEKTVTIDASEVKYSGSA